MLRAGFELAVLGGEAFVLELAAEPASGTLTELAAGAGGYGVADDLADLREHLPGGVLRRPTERPAGGGAGEASGRRDRRAQQIAEELFELGLVGDLE